MDREIKRERLKRRLQAARINSNYKYKNPNNVQVRPSAMDGDPSRPTPFAVDVR